MHILPVDTDKIMNKMLLIFENFFAAYASKKRPFVTTLLAFGLGLAAVFTLMSLGETVKFEILRRFHTEGIDLFTISKRAGTGSIAPRQIRYLGLDVINTLNPNDQYMLAIAPEAKLNQTVKWGNSHFEAPIIGTTSTYQNVFELKLQQGRFLLPHDDGAPVCVITHQVWRQLSRASGSADVLGKTLHIGPIVCRIVGILQASEGYQSDFGINKSILIPFNTLAQYLSTYEVTQITLKANPEADIAEVNAFIRTKLNQYLGDMSNYEVNNQQIFFQQIRDKISTYSVYIGLIGCIFLILGGHAFISLVAQTVSERRPEFRLTRVLGMRRRTLLLQILVETFIFGIFAWLIGITSGNFLLSLLSHWSGWVPQDPASAYWVTALIFIAFSLAVGIYPAIDAANQKLTMTFKTESK